MRRVRNADDGARKRAVLAMSMTPDPALVQAARPLADRMWRLARMMADPATIWTPDQAEAEMADIHQEIAAFGAEQRALGAKEERDAKPYATRYIIEPRCLKTGCEADVHRAHIVQLEGERDDLLLEVNAAKEAALRAARPEGT